MAKKNWGFDTRDMDPKVRPQDDFYKYVNGGWLKRAKMPPHEARWGSFMMLRVDTEKKLRKLVRNLRGRYSAGSPEQMIRDFYRSGMDERTRERLGAAPLRPWLERVEKLTGTEDLLKLFADLEKAGSDGLWGVMIDQDSKNSERYIAHLYQSGLGLPERDYYLKDDPESKRVRAAYEKHVEAILRLLGDSPLAARRARESVMRIERALAEASMSKEDVRDSEKTYHKRTLAALAKEAPGVDWRAYLALIGIRGEREVIAMMPEFLAAAARMLERVAVEDWQAYLRFHIANDSAGALSKRFVRENFEFYGKALAGQKKMKPLWRRALAATNGALGELLGRVYVEQHFTPAAKIRMSALVDDLFEAYAERIKALDWMSAPTKKKALKKLGMVSRKIGYPEKWKSYRGLKVSPADYFGNLLRSAEFEHRRQIKKLGKPVDRSEWLMYPQTVNAYCNFNLNEIVFPAAILQPPFFALTFDDAINYGAIGSVIGHEISHAFDDQGSKFDGNGNMKSWWTPADRKRFERKAMALKRQFDTYKVAGGVPVNGQLTLGENIGDLGGVSIAYDAYQRALARTGKREVIEGFTPEQRFFLGFALFERELSTPEFQKMHALTDPHSPGQFRINGPASNLPEFYAAWGVKKGDTLYRAPRARAKIW
jgi:putative endopeptidase